MDPRVDRSECWWIDGWVTILLLRPLSESSPFIFLCEWSPDQCPPFLQAHFCLIYGLVLEVLLHLRSEAFTSSWQEYFHERERETKVIIQLPEWMCAKSKPALLGYRRPSGRNELSVCLPNKIYYVCQLAWSGFTPRPSTFSSTFKSPHNSMSIICNHTHTLAQPFSQYIGWKHGLTWIPLV